MDSWQCRNIDFRLNSWFLLVSSFPANVARMWRTVVRRWSQPSPYQTGPGERCVLTTPITHIQISSAINNWLEYSNHKQINQCRRRHRHYRRFLRTSPFLRAVGLARRKHIAWGVTASHLMGNRRWRAGLISNSLIDWEMCRHGDRLTSDELGSSWLAGDICYS